MHQREIGLGRSYLLVLRWQMLRMRTVLPLVVVVQACVAVGVVVGLAFLVPDIDGETAAYLSTGAATLGLIIVGLATAPQMVAQSKAEGSYDYTRAWPTPRVGFLLADMTVWMVTALPGLAVALVVAALRFDLDFRVSPLVVPAILLTGVVSTALGYGIASVASPPVTSLVAQVAVFATFLFSPINFPADRLPDWLAAVHEWLPFGSMADIVRQSLLGGDGAGWTDWALVIAWGVLGFAVSIRMMERRS